MSRHSSARWLSVEGILGYNKAGPRFPPLTFFPLFPLDFLSHLPSFDLCLFLCLLSLSRCDCFPFLVTRLPANSTAPHFHLLPQAASLCINPQTSRLQVILNSQASAVVGAWLTGSDETGIRRESF